MVFLARRLAVVLNKESSSTAPCSSTAAAPGYVLYVEGMLTASGIPLGGDHITGDISMCFQIPHARAGV